MITSAISKGKKYLFIIRMSCIFFLINKTHCVFATVATCHLDLTSKYVILIIDRHLLSVCTITLGQPLRQLFYIFTLLSQTLQLSATSQQREQTTVQPPGHQWTGTNHQSEWLLMELEQLPQTIKRRDRKTWTVMFWRELWAERRQMRGYSLAPNSRTRRVPFCSTVLGELDV